MNGLYFIELVCEVTWLCNQKFLNKIYFVKTHVVKETLKKYYVDFLAAKCVLHTLQYVRFLPKHSIRTTWSIL